MGLPWDEIDEARFGAIERRLTALEAKPHAPGCSTGDPCGDCQKQEEPQACPFGHGPASVEGRVKWYVFCRDCDCSGPIVETRAEAIRDWNRITVKP